MDHRQYGKIGTTARAEPVNNQEILYPNGYDRNLNNRERPLVTVCDTAGIDDDSFFDEDFKFDHDSPSDNVTVTIKFSSASDGIVTETATKHTDDYDSCNGQNRNTLKKGNVLQQQHHNDHRHHQQLQDQHPPPPLHNNHYHQQQQQQQSNDNASVLNQSLSEVQIDKSSEKKPCMPSLESSSEYNVQNNDSIQNNLYEEYERFVVPNVQQSDSVVRPKSYQEETSQDLPRNSDAKDKSNIKITTGKESPQRDPIDRSGIVSPIYKTPIVIQSSSASSDEAEDFLEYLKQLKGNNAACDGDTMDNSFVISEKDNPCFTPDKISKDESFSRAKFFKNELVPILTVNSAQMPKCNSQAASAVIVISDEESETIPESKSLLDFNFSSLKRAEKSTGGNCVNRDIENCAENISDSEVIMNRNRKKKRKTKKRKVFTIKTEDQSEDESDTDDTDDENQDEDGENKKDGDKSTDNDDESDSGEGSKETDKSSENESEDHNDNDGNNEGSHNSSDEQDQSNDSVDTDEYENESYFSPGMRSRSAKMTLLARNGDKNTSGFSSVENETSISAELDDDGNKSSFSKNVKAGVLTDRCLNKIDIKQDDALVQVGRDMCKEKGVENTSKSEMVEEMFPVIFDETKYLSFELPESSEKDKNGFEKSTILPLDETIPVTTSDHEFTSHTIGNENTNTIENSVRDIDNSSVSSCAEDKEIIEILDYSETINNLDCTFQTIDTSIAFEYQSQSDHECIQSGAEENINLSHGECIDSRENNNLSDIENTEPRAKERKRLSGSKCKDSNTEYKCLSDSEYVQSGDFECFELPATENDFLSKREDDESYLTGYKYQSDSKDVVSCDQECKSLPDLECEEETRVRRCEGKYIKSRARELKSLSESRANENESLSHNKNAESHATENESLTDNKNAESRANENESLSHNKNAESHATENESLTDNINAESRANENESLSHNENEEPRATENESLTDNEHAESRANENESLSHNENEEPRATENESLTDYENAESRANENESLSHNENEESRATENESLTDNENAESRANESVSLSHNENAESHATENESLTDNENAESRANENENLSHIENAESHAKENERLSDNETTESRTREYESPSNSKCKETRFGGCDNKCIESRAGEHDSLSDDENIPSSAREQVTLSNSNCTELNVRGDTNLSETGLIVSNSIKHENIFNHECKEKGTKQNERLSDNECTELDVKCQEIQDCCVETKAKLKEPLKSNDEKYETKLNSLYNEPEENLHRDGISCLPPKQEVFSNDDDIRFYLPLVRDPGLIDGSYASTPVCCIEDVYTDVIFSESSSSSGADGDETDFESAVEEEFWTKTVGSASETSLCEDFSSSSNTSFDSDVALTDDTDSEYESIDDDLSSVKEESDFVSKIKQILEDKKAPENHTEQPTVKKTDCHSGYGDNIRDFEKTNTLCLMHTDKIHKNIENELRFERQNQVQNLKEPSVRTITYFVPFIKECPDKDFIPGKDKKIKSVCTLRKSFLDRLLPLESLGMTCDRSCDETFIDFSDNTHDLQLTINDLKKKSRSYKNSEETQKVKRPGEIIKLGIGYYIFGAGEKLDLPIGPKLKERNDTEKDASRPSIYFRGVPGIINNACKMSSFSFPKLAAQTDTSSRKILHACNRLATQLSPLEPRQDNKYVTMNKEMAVEDTDDTLSVSSADLTDMLMASRDFLNSSRFDEAETAFLKLYKEIQEKPEDNGRLLVETLTGLADICIRRSRMCRSNPLEWQWLCMHAIALLQYTVEFCDSELESQLDNEATEWYQEQRQASELKCRPLEDAFTRALYNCLKHDANFFDPFQSFSLPNTPVSLHKKPNLFPLSSTMPQYLLVPGMSYRVTDQGLKKHSSDDSDVAVDWLAKFQFYCKDRLQTKDSKCVTEKVLKSTKSTDNEDTESLFSNSSHGSLDWDHSDLHGIDEIELDINEKESPVTDYSLEYELASSETDNEGWDFFLHERRNCDFQSVVQVVSNGEEKGDVNERESSSLDKETQDIYQQEKSEKSRRKHHEQRDIVSPLHAHSISLTLARSFCRLADKLVQEEEYKKAEIVYEKILDIIDSIQDGTAGMLRFSARIMKNLGTVKSKQGKSSSGLVLLNKALNTYRDLQDEEANFEIAVALIELGNGYIVGKNHEDSVFDDVIIAICDFFEKDASDSASTSTSSSVQSHISQMTSSLNSNNEDRNVEEAVTCYTEAISLLDCYEADEKQVDMFAKAIMRLGDCHFMQKDYDKALECYEKALGMFRTYNVFGRDSLMENAHVLCMLGVSSFMLHVYPRAASVFETALHMVRCAYGFKRTFLNGMLQSLSGITYYKMKNYHKCVSMCYQGYETYCELFGEGMPRLDKQKFWLVCQTLYVMGNSYNILNLQQKAVKYLSIARSLMKSSKSRERRQFMRVLQILGDCYFANYDYKTALQFYNEALEYGECESSISFDEVFDPNCASDEMTIHNHLVSKSAEAHLSMQQYQNAVHYLEQAHDMQEVMGEDIKGDLISTLHQLGHMHSVAGDVDKAIESYRECLEVFREIHKGQLGPEMCTTLGNLAAICYVKACIADSIEEEEKMTQAADSYFHEALALENNAEVCVKYGTFLYSQCNFETAIVQFWNALRNDNATADIVYRGLEKVTLPELLQDEVDTHDEICLPSSCLARYLLILCHKAMNELDEAEINLICLMEEAIDYDVPLLHSLLGYAMMELMLFEEAAECFFAAAETEEDYQLACENYCICLLILLQKTILSGLENILEYVATTNPNFYVDYSRC